jgi:hypothetical protein
MPGLDLFFNCDIILTIVTKRHLVTIVCPDFWRIKTLKESAAGKIEELKEFFKNKTVFTLDDLREHYKGIDSKIKETTLKWRIHDLKQKDLIRSVKRGVYTFQSRPPYQPVIPDKIAKKYKQIKKEFPYSECCIWDTRWLNEFMIHQPGKFMILVEVENDSAQSVFYFLQERDKGENVFFKPSEKEIEQYIPARRETVIIRTLTTQAPTREQNGICIPRLEKILVDLFVDKSLFIAYQGQELITIFENAYNQLSINLSTLFRYALRRKKRDQLKDFLLKNKIIPPGLVNS